MHYSEFSVFIDKSFDFLFLYSYILQYILLSSSAPIHPYVSPISLFYHQPSLCTTLFLIIYPLLLEVTLPNYSVCSSVGRLIGRSFIIRSFTSTLLSEHLQIHPQNPSLIISSSIPSSIQSSLWTLYYTV